MSSSTSAASSTTTAADLGAFAQKYLDAVAGENAAAQKFNSEIGSLPSTATIGDVVRLGAPMLAAFRATDHALLAVKWPVSAQGDVDALLRADGVLEGDLSSAGAQSALSLSTWVQKFAADAGSAKASADIVRRDLGLPPSA